jgi:iron complex outermembrane receptor protein
MVVALAIQTSAAVQVAEAGLPLDAGQSIATNPTIEQLRGLSIEDLGRIEITSVSRRPEPLSDAAASVYVITAEDIRRSGAISLPEVLRLAPNLEIARDSAQSYAVSARGFNSTDASNKLLVLIDGRVTYAPVHSGVYWDQQQVPLADIERIEVISGPGGTLWGANAVNGVINIITKPSSVTQGGLVDLKAGPVDQSGLVQWGGRFGQNGTYRVYGSGFGSFHTDVGGHNAGDDWHGAQAGFRTDWQANADNLMSQGNFYRNIDALNGRQAGGDLLGRWTRHLTDGATFELQVSADKEDRIMTGQSDTYESYDVQAQHTVSFRRNLVVWGVEYRLVQDDLVNHANVFELVPPSRMVGIGNVFVQDTLALSDAVKLSFGTKVEDSTYSGVDFLPSVRIGWAVSEATFLWAAISRAVRTPSRVDRDLQAPGLLAPAVDFSTEKLIAYEIGYRGRPISQVSLSISLYYNVYDDLRTTNLVPGNGYLYQLGNGAEGTAFGVESWADWKVLPWWRLSAGVNLMHKDLHDKPGIIDIAQGQSEGFDPGYQFSLRSSMDLLENIELDFGAHAVGQLSNAPIKSYIDGDGRLGWRVNEQLEVSLAGYNLFAPRHAETVTPGNPVYEPRRSVYLGMRWTF